MQFFIKKEERRNQAGSDRSREKRERKCDREEDIRSERSQSHEIP